MRHTHLIDLLLQNNSKPTADESKSDRLLRLNRRAAVIFNQASREAGHNFPPGNYLMKESLAIDTRVTAELSRVNLTNRHQYNTLVEAVEAWQPTGNDSDARSAQIIRKAVIGALPKIQQKQQLQSICQEYKAHLKEDIEAELLANHPQEYAQYVGNRHIKGVPLPDSGKLPATVIQAGKNMDRFVDNHLDGISKGSESLNAAIKKYTVVQNMSRTLVTSQPVDTQIKHFKQEFQSQRSVIEKDRDSWGMKFAKAVASALSLGIAVLCGIWSVKGQQAANDLTQALTSPPPVPGFT